MIFLLFPEVVNPFPEPSVWLRQIEEYSVNIKKSYDGFQKFLSEAKHSITSKALSKQQQTETVEPINETTNVGLLQVDGLPIKNVCVGIITI